MHNELESLVKEFQRVNFFPFFFPIYIKKYIHRTPYKNDLRWVIFCMIYAKSYYLPDSFE